MHFSSLHSAADLLACVGADQTYYLFDLINFYQIFPTDQKHTKEEKKCAKELNFLFRIHFIYAIRCGFVRASCCVLGVLRNGFLPIAVNFNVHKKKRNEGRDPRIGMM